MIRDDLGDQIPKIEDGPWPAFPADLTSIALAVATQARGTILIFEKMFENRLFFVDKLVRMGARIILCDPHRAVVTGPGAAARRAAGEPRHPRRHGDADRRALRRGHLGDRQHRPDRPRLRADRRAAARPRRLDRARSDPRRDAAGDPVRSDGMSETQTGVRVELAADGRASVADRAAACSTTSSASSRAARGSQLVARGRAGQRRRGGRGRRAARSATALAGRSARRGASRPRLGVAAGRRGARRRGARGRPSGRSSRRTSTSRASASAGSRATSSRAFLEELADGAGLNVHIRVLEGKDPQHVLRAIFKALGAALGQACRPPEGGEPMSKEVIRTEAAPGAVPGRAVLAGDQGERLRLRRRPARRSTRRRSESSPGGIAAADRAGVREPAGDPRGGRLVARRGREDDRLPPEPRRLRRR